MNFYSSFLHRVGVIVNFSHFPSLAFVTSPYPKSVSNIIFFTYELLNLRV